MTDSTPNNAFNSPRPVPHRSRALVWYAASLTVIVVVIGGWFIWQQYPSATCPKPKTIQYSYDDPRDYLGGFLAAMTSHDSATVRRYYTRDISAADRQSLEQAMSTYRSQNLELTGLDQNHPWSDIGERAVNGQTFTRLTWTTKKVDGCWRVQRVDTQTLTVGVTP